MKDKKRRAFKVEGDTLYLAKVRNYHLTLKNRGYGHHSEKEPLGKVRYFEGKLS